MFRRISGWFKRSTKRIVAATSEPLLRTYLRKTYIERYGELMDLHVDVEKKQISIRVTLKGEKTPMEITADYKLRDTPDGLSLTITNFQTSKEWLTLLAEDHFVPHTFTDIPRFAKAIL